MKNPKERKKFDIIKISCNMELLHDINLAYSLTIRKRPFLMKLMK